MRIIRSIKFFIFIIALPLISIIGAKKSVDYCDETLCHGRPHIGCNNNGSFAKACPANAHIVKMKPFIKTVIRLHNSLRNLVAGGSLVAYKPARRMATMLWDKSLSKLATMNVKQCEKRHDKCRNTPDFKNVGQNIRQKTYGDPFKAYNDEDLLQELIQDWFSEYKQGARRYMNRYPGCTKGKKFMHFMLMITDRNIRVGCGAIRFRRDGVNHFILTCNYATANIKGIPVYAKGAATTSCATGRNPRFPNLCSIKEFYEGLDSGNGTDIEILPKESPPKDEHTTKDKKKRRKKKKDDYDDEESESTAKKRHKKGKKKRKHSTDDEDPDEEDVEEKRHKKGKKKKHHKTEDDDDEESEATAGKPRKKGRKKSKHRTADEEPIEENVTEKLRKKGTKMSKKINDYEASSDETPSDEAPSDEAPSDETPSDEILSDEAPSDETPSDETPSIEAPSDETPSDETPSDETPSDETPSIEAPSDETPSDETSSDVTPSDETPSDENETETKKKR